MNQQDRQQILDFITTSIALIPVSAEVYDAIYAYSKRHGNGGAGSVASITEHQLWDFLERNQDFVAPIGHSVIWQNPKSGKTVELPHGTELSTKYFGTWLVAKVVDGSIEWDGKTFTTPAQACNAMRGGTQNNAWRELSVKRPGDPDFKPAQLLK